MLKKLSEEEFIALAKTAKRVAVFEEIQLPAFTPMDAFQTLRHLLPEGVIFGSTASTLLAFEPIAKLKIQNKTEDPFKQLRQLISQLSYITRPDMMTQIRVMVGIINYDAVRFFEDIADRHPINDAGLSDMNFYFYRTTFSFDHTNKTLLISILTNVSENLSHDYHLARNAIKTYINNLKNIQPIFTLKCKKTPSMVYTDINDTTFMDLVQKAKKYIMAGDAFQIVLSRCFTSQYTADPLNIYQVLYKNNSSPYLFYLPIDDQIILGASPEKMITVYQGKISVNPIAGTRPHNKQDNDAEIGHDLLNDPKDLAEHLMLVDLARNDLSMVCQPGSVKVEEFMQVKHYTHISHITSIVTGQLCANKDAWDGLAAAFPAGTLSGAPKIRAMQIIDELETSRRGLYGGVICTLDYQGNLDSCIAIRMAILKDGIATVRAGAGIVHDSDPWAEAQETRHKAKSMLTAIALAHQEALVC